MVSKLVYLDAVLVVDVHVFLLRHCEERRVVQPPFEVSLRNGLQQNPEGNSLSLYVPGRLLEMQLRMKLARLPIKCPNVAFAARQSKVSV
jgi:hypothetical protein